MNIFLKKIGAEEAVSTFHAWVDGVSTLLHEPCKWILHPSVWRLRWIGMFILIGNPLFYLIWTRVLPQPFESLTVRLTVSALGLVLLLKSKAILRGSVMWQKFYAVTIFIQLPLLFLQMANLNNLNTVWLGSCVAMVLIYYQLTDWRLATLGVTISTLLLMAFKILTTPFELFFSLDFLIFTTVFIFAWLSALASGGSTANVLKQQLQTTAYNLGVMAHELRTPISSINILNHLLQRKSIQTNDAELAALSGKLGILIRTINQHIDDQIANVKQDYGDITLEPCSALLLVQKAVAQYPFQSESERSCISVQCTEDFQGLINATMLGQVFNNLIKNALRAMRAKELLESQMRLIIQVGVESSVKLSSSNTQSKSKGYGYIKISDNGCGIKANELKKVMNPFISSAGLLGHGLGLPFCKNVLLKHKGELLISSQENIGTCIRLELDLDANITEST